MRVAVQHSRVEQVQKLILLRLLLGRRFGRLIDHCENVIDLGFPKSVAHAIHSGLAAVGLIWLILSWMDWNIMSS
jgi:hypothetical protein